MEVQLERMMRRNLGKTLEPPGETEETKETKEKEAEVLSLLLSSTREGERARKLAYGVFRSMNVPSMGLSGPSKASKNRSIAKAIAFCCIHDAVGNRAARSARNRGARSGDDPQVEDIDPCNLLGTLYAAAERGSTEEAEQIATFRELKAQGLLRGLDEDERFALETKFHHVNNGTTLD